MKKINRERVAKFASRFFLVLMSFILILSLCSATAPSASIPVTIQNPDNIPQDFSFSTASSSASLDFGLNYVDATLVHVVDGFVEDMPISLPDGSYYFFGIVISQTLGYSSSLSFSGELYEFEGSPLYLSDNPVITVIDGNSLELEPLVFFAVPVNITDTFTSVWTSITNWVISSLNTVQGLFYGSGEEIIAPDTSSSDTVEYNGVTYYPFDFAYAEDVGGGLGYFNGVEISEDDYIESATTINGHQYIVVSYGGVPIMLLNTTTNGTYSSVGFEIVIQSDGSLTLLGTLTVIGLSISLAFLVIGVISRFLKLRG